MSFSAWIWNGNALVPGTSLSLADRGLRHGLSVFETLLVHQGRACFLREHLASLEKAARHVGLPVPEGFEAAVGSVFSTAPYPQAVARIYLTAGEGLPGTPAEKCGGFVSIDEHLPAALPHPGLRVCVDGIRAVDQDSLLAGLKTGNYWLHHAARMAATEALCDEAILLNRRGEVVCGSMSNVFVRIGERLMTPVAACGAREGIVRGWILANGAAEACVVTREMLAAADEIFLTNSVQGIRSAHWLEGRELHPANREQTAAALRERYAAAL